MNKTEVVTYTAEKTGITADICKAILDAFEKQSEEAFAAKFKGTKYSHTDMVAGVVEKTGLPAEDCDKVIIALDEVLDNGLSKKLRFKK